MSAVTTWAAGTHTPAKFVPLSQPSIAPHPLAIVVQPGQVRSRTELLRLLEELQHAVMNDARLRSQLP